MNDGHQALIRELKNQITLTEEEARTLQLRSETAGTDEQRKQCKEQAITLREELAIRKRELELMRERAELES